MSEPQIIGREPRPVETHKYTASFRDPERPHTLSEWTFEAMSFGDAYTKYLGQVWSGCELLSLVKVER